MYQHPKLADCRRIFIRNYRLNMEIGIHQHEKKKHQFVLVNIDLWVPLAQSTPKQDNVEEIVDYDFVRSGIQEIVRRGHINLQETLCDAIVEMCLAHPKICAVRVCTEKSEAYSDCECAGIEVFRLRDSQ